MPKLKRGESMMIKRCVLLCMALCCSYRVGASDRERHVVTAADLLGPLRQRRINPIWRDAIRHVAFIPHTHTILYLRGKPETIEILNTDTNQRQTIGVGNNPVASPNGEEIAFSAEDDNGVNEVWVEDTNGGGRRQLTRDPNNHTLLDVRQIIWSPDSRFVAYKRYGEIKSTDTGSASQAPSSSQSNDDEASTVMVFYPNQASRWFPHDRGTISAVELHVVPIEGEADRVVAKLDGPFVEIPDLVWNGRTGSLAVDLKERRPEGPNENVSYRLVSISLATGEMTTLMGPTTGIRSLEGMRLSPDGEKILFGINPMKVHYPLENELAIFDCRTRQLRILDYIDGYIEYAEWNGPNHLLIGLAGAAERVSFFSVNVNTKRIQRLRLSEFPSKLSFSSDGRLMSWQDLGPLSDSPNTYVANVDGTDRKVLQSITTPDLYPEYRKGVRTRVSWRSSDGLKIEGFLTMPVDWNPGKKYPLMVYLHGGPGFALEVNPSGLLTHSPLEIDYWAGRGYIIFTPDYRSSQAYGWSQITKRREANDAFDRDFDDIMSGVDSVIARGDVDSNRMAIVGHSYGSYEVNWIISHTNRFKAAISYEGGDILWDWDKPDGPNESLEWLMRGTPLTRPLAYIKESAVHYAAKINTPTMFINGEMGVNSPSMPWLYSALVSRGIDSQFLYYAKESHVIDRPVNKADLFKRATKWIDDHLDYHPEN
jgi:dipeptidyl aminopeptidase/acylaminoacyl peptidase